MSDKNKIFTVLCNHCSSIMDGWIPYPSTVIHKSMPHLSLYAVRKYLKELKQEGLIISDLYVDQGDERPILVRGWVVTKKGEDTDEYRQAAEAERKLCEECFGMSF